MGLLKNDCWDRIKIREKTFFTPEEPSLNQILFTPEGLKSKYTPVLLSFWTKDYLDTFLVPATQVELEMLKRVNGIDYHGTGWEKVQQDLNYILVKIANVYEVDDELLHVKGDWREKYLVDMEDEEGNPLPPVTLPHGTVLVVTGYILP